MTTLEGRRVLLAGAESNLAPGIAAALTQSGARVALVAMRSDADSAFTAQRLARKVGAGLSQAIDGSNDAAIRVMVRQVAKALGGIDAVVASEDNARLRAHAARELERTGGAFLVAAPSADETLSALAAALRNG